MGGASRGITNLKYNKAGGSKFVSMAEELDSIRENEVKLAEFQENKKHTAEQVEDYAKRVDTDNYESIQRISETLKSLPANKRGNAFLTAPDLHNIFEANGEIKADIQNNFKDVSNMNVSAGIRHQTSKLNEVLKGVNERHNTNFELDTDKLNETERTTLAKVTSAVSRLAKSSKYKAYAGLDVAIIKNAKNENAFIKDGVIYLSREHLSSGEWAKHVAHEVTHFTEGSKEYNAFAKFLTEDAQAVNRASEAIANQGYGYTAEQVKNALAKVNRGETLTESEQEAYSELISHIAEEILGNEDSINRLTAKNKSLANRIYERIKSFLRAFTGTNADKETVARLRKAEKLFAKALENTGKAQAEMVEQAKKDYEEAQKQAKTLDNEPAVAYSKKGYTPRNPSKVTKQEFNHHYWAIAYELLSKDELGMLNSAITNLNDGTSYEQNSDGFYMIPIGENGVLNKIVFTDGKQDYYSINQIIVIYRNNETELSDIREFIYERENIGISTETTDLFETYYAKAFRYSDFVGSIQKNERDSNGEQNGRGSSGKTQFSLKTTEYKKVKENLNEFKTIDELKEYFGEVQKEINEEAQNYYPRTMQEINENERRRIEKVIEVANLEKEAIKEYRKLHSKKPKVDLNTKAQMEAIDKKYTEAIANNDIETAKYLVEQMAILKGYAVTDYQIDHKAPTNDGYNARLDDVTPMYGEDIYSTNAVRYFGTFEGFDNESIRHIQEAKGKPDKIVTVYRAVPESVKGDQIRNGDWITLTYDYAKNHGQSNILGNYRVIRKKVKASEIFTDGNSIHEFGYDDGKEYYYGDTTNYRKLADAITFDDEGNPIRLIDRFNYRSDDVRFSRKETDDILSKDFTALDLEEYFDSLSLAELTELIEELEAEDPILNQNERYVPKLSKEERRELYVSKLYEQGKLNEFVTKLVKSKPQMAKYFANTKMNNKYNPLMPSNGDEYIVMFHGTPNQFNEFDTKKVGKHGTVMGSGIYFTKSLAYAEDYKEEGGRVMATLLNIEKPLSRNSHTFTKSDLKRFIKEVVDAEGDDYLSNYGDVYRLGYDKLLNTAVDKVYDYNSNDVDIIEDIYVTSRMDFDEFHDGLTKVLGYDGIIAWNKAEGTQAVIFKSNQAKDIFNFNPTSSSDIRFSRKEKTTELPVVDISVDEELTQRIANSEKSIITTIQNYIFEKYGNYTFNLSDGKKAKIDNSDAKKLGYTAKEAKQAQISNLIELVENAKFIIETNKVKHNKFNAFSYYAIKANYKGQIYELAINVGRTKNDFSWHIYEINELPKIIKYIKKELPAEHLSVWGGFESFSLKNSSLFNPTITQENEDVKSFNENSSEKFSRKEVQQGETEFLTKMPQEKKTIREKVVDNSKETWINLQTQLTNQQAGLEKELKRLGVKDAEAKTHLARASYNAGQIILEEGFIDENGNVIGKSLQDIWNPIYKKGEEYQREFNEYLFNYLHIDRLKVDKGILNNVTEKQAKEKISQLEAQHPEFKQLAKDVWQYNKNLMKERIKLGLVTDEVADYMNNMYPHYVPAFTEGQENKQSISATSSNNTVKQTIKGAKGSVDNKLPPDVIMARQTMEVMRAGRLNQLLNSLYDGVVQKGDNTNVSVIKIEQRWQPNKTEDAIKEAKKNANEVLDLMNEDYSTYDNQPHQYTFYRGSEKITISVSDDIDIGLSAFKPNQEYRNTLINLVTKGNDIFKRLVTSANPFFVGRNAIRDLQEALFYSKAPARFIGYWIKAFKEMKSNGKYWRLYKSLGGMSSGLFDYNTGIKRHKGVIKKTIGWLEKANMVVEQAPRLAEFIISMERGASAEQALLDSAEVTTNFSRGGKTAKFLNRTVMPFLNPSIQGWSKLYRTVTAKKTIEEWGMLILKALVLGIGVSALNDLLLGDDEEYQSLSIRDKENNYLIKIGDNFLKLPKGRVLSVFGSLWIRGREQAKGNENAWDGYIESMSSAVTPVDSFSRTIFSPITDAKTNTTWYGGQIEGRQFENLAPEDRYDESTSSIAIFLGKTFGTSPKKVHYVIDQYSGVIGDVVLPATAQKVQGNFVQKLWYGAKEVTVKNWVIDSTLSTRYQNEFYTALDEAYFAKNKGDINANYIVRYLNSISTEVSDMYATKREIERSDKSNADKQAETKVIQSLINTTNKTALEGAKVLETAVKGLNVEQQNKLLQSNNKFLKLDENAQKRAIQKLNDYYYALAMNKAFGIELEEKYTKYSKFNSPELFVYLTEIGSIEGDKDKQGNTISGSRKANILKYLKSKGVTSAKQDIILDILGYSTTTK